MLPRFTLHALAQNIANPTRGFATTLLLVASAAIFAFAPGSALAQAESNSIAYQGELVDVAGNALVGPVELELRIFDASEAGNLLYAESHLAVELADDGSFVVALGGGTNPDGSFDSGLFAPGLARYLETVVDTEVMSPRQKMGTVPWAFVAREAMSLANAPTLVTDFNNLGGQVSANSADVTLIEQRLAAQGPHERPGSLNTAVGEDALMNNTTGAWNSAHGHWALASNTTGFGNSAQGMGALWRNTTGGGNTAVGLEALESNETGDYNTAVGWEALSLNYYGHSNTAVGADALEQAWGSNNIGIGVSAGRLLFGDNNIMIGHQGTLASSSGEIRIGTPGTHTVTVLSGDVLIGGLSVAARFAELEAQVAMLTGRPPRFEACADGVTVADNETGLLWERKTTTGDVHDVGNNVTWSSTASAEARPYTEFLATLNTASGFAGHTDWRLPIISELQSIMVGQGVTKVSGDVDPSDPAMGTNPTGQLTLCSASPCIDPRFAAIGGPTTSSNYWSASSLATNPNFAWVANFGNGNAGSSNKTFGPFVRAVRAGSCGS